MKRQKLVAFLLALVFTFSTIAPLSRAANESLELEISELRSDLFNAVQSVEDIVAADEKEQELLDEFHEAADFLEKEIKLNEEKQRGKVGAVGAPEAPVTNSILDLTTIPVRIQLLARIGRAIRFATTELSNKVVAAHTKIAEYIFVGILHVLNPFASENQILDYIQQFEALEQELLAYPDLAPHDIATIYKKAAVDRELWAARRLRNDTRRRGGKFQAEELNKVISETTRMRLRIAITCGELDEQVEKLHQAMEVITGPKIRVERIEFTEGPAGAIAINKRTRIRPVVLPYEVKNKDVFLYSSNPFVARVSGSEIIPLKTGSVNITAVAKDNGVKANFELYILEPGELISGIPMLEATGNNNQWNSEPGDYDIPAVGYENTEVKDISFTRNDYELEQGQDFDLGERTLVFPETALDKSLTYRSSDESIAQVDENGLVHGLAAGEVDIIVEAVNGVKKSFPLKVVNTQAVDKIVITDIEISPRTAGIFTIKVQAEKNDEKYSGPANISISSDDRTLDRRFYLKRGVGEITFTGFDFGVWRKDFQGHITIRDAQENFQVSY